MDYKNFITTSLQEAGKIAHRNFGMVSGTTKPKDNNQVLTETDLEIGRFLIQRVQAVYPDHNIIDEEAGAIDKAGKYTWVIDPIDGTSNFANGVPTYGIYLGLLEDDQPIAGGIMLPAQHELLCAIRGEGAFCNEQRIRVTDEANLLRVLVAYQVDGHQENPAITEEEAWLLGKIILRVRNIRTSNSAFDGALVAKGAYGAVLNKTSKIWDNVAAQVVIEEAGGVYTDFYGNKIEYSNPLTRTEQNFTYCAGSANLHRQLQEVIHAE